MLGELLDRSPRRIGPYRILARLGAGGMGEVYLGADTRPHPAHAGPRLVAVKTVRAELVGDGALRDRFRREMETARSVESRFTARLLDGDADAPEPWLATEYVAGPTLGLAVRTAGPLPVETVRSLGLGLVRALRGIHHARVQHRDLKPGNILLGSDGPKVIDFGIARYFGASTMTATGAMVGSPGFMSPEHVRGGRHVVAASDVFCLASVLCYAATGEGPFGDGPVAGVLYRVLQAEADLTGVPDEVRELIGDCLHADPSSRPDTVALEARFRAVTDTADASGGAVVWPAPVQALVAADEAELGGVVAAAGPLAEPVPTMPGAAPVHSADTVTGAPPRPAAPPPGPRPGRLRGRTLVALAVAGFTVGVLGAFGLKALREDGGDRGREASGAPSGSPSPPAPDVLSQTGVDRHGVERSRYFPVAPAARPDGWKPWTERLEGRPWSCALNSELLVCRTYDGGLEAVRASDGKPLWKAASPAPGEEPYQGRWGVVIPGRGSNPLIHGDTVVSSEGGTVRGRSARDGTVRWEHPTGAGEETDHSRDALLGDGVAFFTLAHGATTVLAFDAVTGKQLWNEELTSYDVPMAGYGAQGAELFAEGRIIVRTDSGLTGFEARSGKATAVDVPNGGYCGAMRAHGGQIYCDIAGRDPVILDAVTLRQVPPAAPGSGTGKIGAEDVIPAGGTSYKASVNFRRGRFELVDLTPGREDRAPRGVDITAGTADVSTEPVIVGSTALLADNRHLYTLPLSGGEGKRHEIEGAPGNEETGGRDGGPLDAPRSWKPEVISLGGALYIAFHDGTVRSMELPG
ncbi:protein kinase [Streptomyces sp. MUM 203J]|uniref:serine/threonine-protein kinase n=1 Tax=Streptomyces sp. MUM 203J TaxID=2791990 RepID=UPI001F043577|nr:serine/threonine-protein kinase [Streptomyces sp. MUM 203J]MCH0541593.1 protein kinase [Streptomyces sp. MUM 203J]